MASIMSPGMIVKTEGVRSASWSEEDVFQNNPEAEAKNGLDDSPLNLSVQDFASAQASALNCPEEGQGQAVKKLIRFDYEEFCSDMPENMRHYFQSCARKLSEPTNCNSYGSESPEHSRNTPNVVSTENAYFDAEVDVEPRGQNSPFPVDADDELVETYSEAQQTVGHEENGWNKIEEEDEEEEMEFEIKQPTALRPKKIIHPDPSVTKPDEPESSCVIM